MDGIQFLDNDGTFELDRPEDYSYLYFPLASEKGLKSSITPNLGGDIKIDQTSFLLEPVSAENLHNNRSTRNFWAKFDNGDVWSAAGSSAEAENDKFTKAQDNSKITAGFMWQTIERESKKYGISAEITSFVPGDLNAEVMSVKLKNTSDKTEKFTPVAAVPIYGRSADNIRDHRNVTSMLHRIHTDKYGIIVTPTMSFDERGHKKNHTSYFVYGESGEGKAPEVFYPTVDLFLGEGGTFTHPGAVYRDLKGAKAGEYFAGREAVGALQFAEVTLAPGEEVSYTVLLGITPEGTDLAPVIDRFSSTEKTESELKEVKDYWKKEVSISYHTGNHSFDELMKWVTFQPFLRRIFGCSFLPHHDYGRGGRGWRDLWQDSLSLLMMNPKEVRDDLVSYFGGVRIDGTNATIIGDKPGEFKADRNGIARVWMDHAFWPFVTTRLYLDQTGDMEILFEKVPYFKDLQSMRGTAHDKFWNSEYGQKQKTERNHIYFGTVLEHILLQNLCAFYDVGDHNEMRLHGADWNDALDMAWEKGESVAFTCAYAGNLRAIAKTLRQLEEISGSNKIEIALEMEDLLAGGVELYEDAARKQALLAGYAKKCEHNISGDTIVVRLDRLAANLEEKADWMMKNIRSNEWVKDGEDGWFNGYYDNHGRKVEGIMNDSVRMMLTGQVFAIMSGTATEDQVESICRSADKYLYDQKAGGYRLNTNFHEEKFDLGRMFGFAYGEKENGAVFSHMAVMYSNALYQRGFAKEGNKVLQALLDAAMEFDNSKMYPGLPEYFDNQGRGLYAYLTGAASWYMLTLITEVFGVKGDCGDLKIAPALMPEQYNQDGKAALKMTFAGRNFEIIFYNKEKKEFDQLKIRKASCDGKVLEITSERCTILSKKEIQMLSAKETHKIEIELV